MSRGEEKPWRPGERPAGAAPPTAYEQVMGYESAVCFPPFKLIGISA